MAVDNRYTRGQIYTIRSHLTDAVYVGSTIQPLCKRFSEHKRHYRMYKEGNMGYITSFDIFDIDLEGAFIELYEIYPCESKAELNRREGQVIRGMDCVNKRVAGRTKAEWYQQNKQIHLDRVKEYQKNNKHKISYRKNKKHECSCGGRYTHANTIVHSKTIKHRMFLFKQHNIFNHL